jgi:hypothetical protein
VLIRSFSFSTNVASSTGPLSKGPTIAPVNWLTESTLPTVKSTSLTLIPGEKNLKPFGFL